MGTIWLLMIYGLCAGGPVFLGGLASRIFEKRMPEGEARTEIIHALIAAGGGIILAAVSFVLAPAGIEALSVLPSTLIFLAGAFGFYAIDRVLASRSGTYAQLLAMLMDFLPEAIALGAVIATDHRMGLLLALLIGLQNLPEAFNSYRDLRSSGFSSRRALTVLFALVWIGPIAAGTGHLLLQGQPVLTGALMLFAAGGLVYLIFQDIAPASRIKARELPAVGASLGFLIGMVGHQLLG